MRPYTNILVIQTAFIGDAILASSLLEKLHARFPDAAISLLVRKGNEGLYLEHPFLKEVLVWNKQEKKLRHLLQLLGRIRRNRYDCVINCHRYASSGFLTAFSGAQHTAGYKQNPFSFLFNTAVRHVIGDGRHETERYNQLTSDFAGNTLYRPKLYPTPADQQAVLAYQHGPYVCMAPASVWFTKQLPAEKWVSLCRSLPPHLTIYLLGAASDVTLCTSIAAASQRTNVHVLAGQLSLLQSCALLAGASMNYVNDSSPLHLASAANAPVTAFFTSTVPSFGFGPLSDTARVIEVQGLSCKPCGLHGYAVCPEGHFKCGHAMPLENALGS